MTRRSVGSLVLAFGLTLGACGGGEPARDAARTTPTAQTTQTTQAGSGSGTGSVEVLGASVQRAAPEADEAAVRELTAAQTAFAVDLYRTLADEEEGDLVVGPGSLHTALSMVRAGARAQTAAEMDAVLGTGELGESLHERGNALAQALESRNDADGIKLAIANRMWSDRGLTLLPTYVETIAGNYGAGLATLDIAGDPEAARGTINADVAASTRDKITELFPAGSIDESSRLVLTNAVHLEAKWQFPFDPEATYDAPFTLPEGTRVDVPTMHFGENLPSGAGTGWVAVELPYDGDQLAMTVVVPDDLAELEARLSPELLAEMIARPSDGGIHLSLPRFTARTHLSLPDTLAAMGMPTAFSGGADFSGMTGASELSLQSVEHEAVVEVDEEGTVAAAASGGVMLGSHGPTVTVDRPFLFAVHDRSTGAVLFLGRVTDPR